MNTSGFISEKEEYVMGTGDRKRLRELMEELAKVEGNIFYLRAYSPNNPLNTLGKQNNLEAQPPKNRTIPWIVGTVATLLLFPPAALYTGYRAYQANKAYKARLEEWNSDQNVKNNLVEMVTMQEKRREELLVELRKLCTENPSLDGDYWWKDQKLNPAVAGDMVQKLLPGSTPSDAEWQFGLLNQLWTVEDGAYLFLMDMWKYMVNIYAEDALEMVNPTNSKILYKNDDLLSAESEAFQLAHLYAYNVEQIQEVVKSTIRTAVDKDAERAAYQRKLDIQESILNGSCTGNFMSDEEMQATGRIGMSEYVDRSLVRGMYEADFEAKLFEKGDYEENSTYSRRFRGLSRITLYNCADVLVSLEPKTNGQCAAILVPRTEQKIMCLLVRSVQEDNPFVGRLETYGEIPEFEQLDSGEAPSIQMAVDKLLSNPDMIKLLHLKNRDVLEEKPENMDEYEYAYLIWKDNPQGRVS
jgi:hypothetical protein